MTKDTTESTWLHSLRQEFKAARRKQIDLLRAKLGELERLERQADFADYRRREIERIDKQSASFLRKPISVHVEDAIFTRLVEAEELLTVALGLFSELGEEPDNWLFGFKSDIADARWALHNTVNDRS